MRALILGVVFVCLAVGGMVAEQGRVPARMPGGRLTTAHECAASLGSGVKSRRVFCDVVITTTPAESISMTLPPRTGPATLFFDLHNRFGVPAVTGFPGVSYTRHEAVARVIGGDGAILGRAAVVREFRTPADLFDQLVGGRLPGGVKTIAPGPAESVRVVVPDGVTILGITGERLRVRTGTSGDEEYDAPGRPVAIVSNVRLEYRPR